MDQEEKPLLVMEYEAGRVLWRLFFPNGIAILFFGFMAIHEINESTKFDYNLESIASIAFFSFIALSSLFLSFEILLVKEIRFYIRLLAKLIFQQPQIHGQN